MARWLGWVFVCLGVAMMALGLVLLPWSGGGFATPVGLVGIGALEAWIGVRMLRPVDASSQAGS